MLGNNIASVFTRDWHLKFCLKNSIFGPFWGQNVGPGWVKNDKNGYFHTSHLTPNSVFPKKEVLKSHSLLTTQKNENYLSEGRNPLACLLGLLVSAKKFSAWVYWKVFFRFWPIKPRDFSHVVLFAPIYLVIIFYHSFYSMTSRF